MSDRKTLRFYARGTAKVTVPGFRPVVDQAPRYVGRIFQARVSGSPAGHPASEQAFECLEGSEAAARCIEITRRDGDLWPADEQTAELCRVPYVPLVFEAGAWVPASAAPTAQPTKPERPRSAAAKD